MPDDDLPRDGAGTAAAANGERPQPGDGSAFDLSALFPHEHGPEQAAGESHHDDVGALFADLAPSQQIPAVRQDEVDDLHLTPATALIDTTEGHLFDEAEIEAHPYTHSFPSPVPARPEPQHAQTYGFARPQAIAMAVGLVITAAGAGWALATPAASAPVTVQASPTATVDPERVANVNESVDTLAAAVVAAKTSADSFAAPLAAMAGSSDESARLAADAARQAYVAAIAAVKVPKPAGKSATNASLDQLERDIAAGHASLTAASAGFRGAITTFRQSIPAFAATAVAENADAAEPFRIAATDTAAAAAASDPFGPTPFAAMEAWRSALAALIADQARAVAEGESSGSGRTGGTGTSGGTTTEPTVPPTEPSSPPPSDPSQPPVSTPPADPTIVLPSP
ncbi:hypothetical protein LXM50_15295 [Microbacterium sp. Au-Mic1]|uniref:hypothetical protein n=1 Tax=Microbacterium sp. Au-Mic1 TaxID=2906457 RepID=UPI001E5FF3F9|nr:hypothetical protein [Microbacterium sp. Au-Mic1]MCE4027339.1 hypothetical protein [Microbacterium sp. Au-Mic1]